MTKGKNIKPKAPNPDEVDPFIGIRMLLKMFRKDSQSSVWALRPEGWRRSNPVDITEIVNTRKSLRKANELFRLAVVVRDSHDAVTVKNLTAISLHYRANEAVGTDGRSII